MLLYAEDNPVNQRLIRDLCAARGHSVDIVEDGVEAVKAAEATDYRLVLMDIHMPNMDGIEATRQIRAMDAPISKAPILILTADDTTGIKDRCRDAGATEVFFKPLNYPHLLEVIADHLNEVAA